MAVRNSKWVIFIALFIVTLCRAALGQAGQAADMAGAAGAGQGASLAADAGGQGAAEQQFSKALQYAEAEDWEKAARLFEELHRQMPARLEITNNLAVACFNLGRLDKAQQLLAEVLEANTETRTSFRNLQLLYGYLTAEAYRQGLGSEQKSKLPTLMLRQTLGPH